MSKHVTPNCYSFDDVLTSLRWQCIVLYCIVLWCIVLWCSILDCIKFDKNSIINDLFFAWIIQLFYVEGFSFDILKWIWNIIIFTSNILFIYLLKSLLMNLYSNINFIFHHDKMSLSQLHHHYYHNFYIIIIIIVNNKY